MAALHRILKRLAWAVLALLLALIAINAYDPPLSDTAKAMSVVPANPYPPEQNLYVAMRGFAAPAGEPVVAQGLKEIAADARIAELSRTDPAAARKLHEAPPGGGLAFRGTFNQCQPLKTSCWQDVGTHAALVERLGVDNGELLRRYLELHRLAGYHETVAPSLLARFPYTPGNVRNLFLAKTALRARSALPSQRAGALSDLHADIRLWRSMLKGEGTLISKMLAIAYLHADLLFLGDMLADRSIDWTPHAGAIDALLGTMEGPDWSIGAMARSEFRFVRETYSSLSEVPWWAGGEDESAVATWMTRVGNWPRMHFFQLRDTLNHSAQMFQRIERLGNASSASYPQARAAYQAWVDAEMSPGFSVYNPVGRVLNTVATPAYPGYSERARDVEALHRMVQLVHEIRKARVADDAIPGFLAAHPEWATHPVGATPFAWDAKTRTLSVRQIAQPKMERRFDISFAPVN